MLKFKFAEKRLLYMSPPEGPEGPPEETADKPAERPMDNWRRSVFGEKVSSDLAAQKVPDLGEILEISEKEKTTFTKALQIIIEKETYKNLEFTANNFEELVKIPSTSDPDLNNPESLEQFAKTLTPFLIVILSLDSLPHDQIKLPETDEGKAIREKLKDKNTWKKNIALTYKANKLEIFYIKDDSTKIPVAVVEITDEQLKSNLQKFLDFAKSMLEKPENPDDTPDQPAGKLHATYEEKIDKVPEETAKTDLDTMVKVDIGELRKNPRLLNKPVDNEKDPDKVTNTKDEVARRIRTFTSAYKNGWYTLDYSKADENRSGPSHESNTGLGEVFGVDPDITELMVERKNGKRIKCTRGTVTSGYNEGRIAYLDAKGKYVITHSGDKVKILNQEETDVKDADKVTTYVQKLSEDNKSREEHATVYAQGMKETDPGTTISSITYKTPETKIEGSNLTVQKIQAAEKEATSEGSIEKVLDRPNFMAVVNYAAKLIEIPPWVLLGVMFHESRFNYLVKNKEHQGERGIGQFKAAAWSSTRKNEKFQGAMKQVINEDPASMERQSSILADVIGIAIYMKKAIPEVNHLTHLTQEQLEDMRWRYHVPSYRAAIKGTGKFSAEYLEKAKAFQSRKKESGGGIYGYKSFADNCLKFETAWKSKFGDAGDKADW